MIMGHHTENGCRPLRRLLTESINQKTCSNVMFVTYGSIEYAIQVS